METINIHFEGSFISTYTTQTKEEYKEFLKLGHKWGWTKEKNIFIKRQNMEKAMNDIHNIIRARFRNF